MSLPPDDRQMVIAFSEFLSRKENERKRRAATAYPLKCMKTQAPVDWNHQNCTRDIRTIAVWCGCDACHASLSRS